jgi:hypothetical protein
VNEKVRSLNKTIKEKIIQSISAAILMSNSMLLSQFKKSKVLCTFKLKGWNGQYHCIYSLTKDRLKVKTNYKTWIFINVKEEYTYLQ